MPSLPNTPTTGNGAPAARQSAGTQTVQNAAKKIPVAFTRKAANFAGETVAAQTGVNLTGEVAGPFAVIAGGFRNMISSVKAAGKDPKRLIPALILGVLWLVLGVLQALGVNFLPVRAMSFLTFANAGLSGGIVSAIGGIIGKGVFAGAVCTLIRSLTTKKTGQKRSFGDIVKGAIGISGDTIWSWLGGIGAALFLFSFLSGGISRYSFMGGVAAAYLTAKAALSGGFLSRLVSSVTAKIRGRASSGAAGGFLRGMTIGFSAGAVLGLLNINLILIIVGALLVLTWAVMLLLQKTGVLQTTAGNGTVQ